MTKQEEWLSQSQSQSQSRSWKAAEPSQVVNCFRLIQAQQCEQSFQAAAKPLRRGRTSHMDSNTAGSVQYDRWNEDNINMNVEASQSAKMRTFDRVCTGNAGVAVKVAGALAAMVSIYIIGYVTGYYVHRCP